MLQVFARIGDCPISAIPNSCIPLYRERMVGLKKIACLLACCGILLLGTVTAFAGESVIRVSQEQIALRQSQTNFEAEIEISPKNPYAGVEIGVACPKGVTMTASSGSSGNMSAGPVLAGDGLYWTSFFASDNTLSETMKITLQFSCTQSFETGDIQLHTVKVLTKNGSSVDTEEQTPAVRINVMRSGAQTTDTDSAADSTDSETEVPSTDSALSDSSGSTPAGGKTDSGSHLNSTDSVEKASNPNGDATPETGDDNSLVLWLAVAFAAGIALSGTVAAIWKKRTYEK